MVPAATIAAAVCLFLCLPRLLLIYILFCLFIYQQFTVNFIYGEMYFQSLVSHKHLDEFIYVPLFIAVITVNKYVLSVLNYTVPTVFQGWQTFVCVLSLSLLIKFQKIKNEIQILERQSVYLLLPWLICFTASIVSGSKALADLPVPVFVAFTNLHPAFLILFDEKTDKTGMSSRVCGSFVIFGTAIMIIVLNIAPFIKYLYMLGHVALNILQTQYMEKLKLNLTSMTKIYYRNFFSVIVLLPISIYLDLFHFSNHLHWRFIVGCFLSGIFGTFLQCWTFRVEFKNSFLNYQGLAKLLCSILAYELFYSNIEPIVWLLIVINLLAGFLTLSEDGDAECKSKVQSVVITSPPIEVVTTVEKSREEY